MIDKNDIYTRYFMPYNNRYACTCVHETADSGSLQALDWNAMVHVRGITNSAKMRSIGPISQHDMKDTSLAVSELNQTG
jgi:hypothetical protein